LNEILLRIIIQHLSFLELSSDEIINQDAAIQEIENICSELENLSSVDKKKFRDFVKTYAEIESTAGQPEERVEFIKNIPESLGLINHSDDE